MFIMLFLASQLHFLVNRNTKLAVPPLFWSVKCIKIAGHVALLSSPSVYSLFCATTNNTYIIKCVFVGFHDHEKLKIACITRWIPPDNHSKESFSYLKIKTTFKDALKSAM